MEDADRRERIEMMIMGYMSKVENARESLPTYLESRKGKEIDEAMQLPDPNNLGGRVNAVTKDGHYYMILEDENGNYTVEELNMDLDNIGGGITLASPENFDKEKNGTMTFDPGEDGKSTLVFSDKINDEFCFDIQSGEVTIYIDNDMTLTNEGLSRSAINIEPNAKLNLYIADGVTLTVNSGFGEKGQIAEGFGAKGGPGGYAGIRVPWIDNNNDNVRDEGEQAELNLYGEGTVVAIGGDAGSGAGAQSENTGGRRRSDGAGARNWRKPEEKAVMGI